MEVKNLSKKERFLKWWHIEGKIECLGGAIMLGLLIVFWNNALVEGILGIVAALWGFGRIYFRRDQWLFLTLISGWVFLQGITHLLKYFRS